MFAMALSGQTTNWFKELGPAQIGALWGAGLFLCLWIGMLGTLGEILILLPFSYTLDILLSFIGTTDGQSTLWRVVAGTLSLAVSSVIGSRIAPNVFLLVESLPRSRQIIIKVSIPLIVFMIILIGRILRIH